MSHHTPVTSTRSVSITSTSGSTGVTSSLLTRFTPPADCTTTWWSLTDPKARHTTSPPGAIVSAAFDYGSSHGGPCWLQRIVPDNGGPVLYSPGVCRAGYTPASTISIGQWGSATTSLCCLNGLTYLSSGVWDGNCGGTITSHGMTIAQSAQGLGTREVVTGYTVVDSFYAVDLPYTVAWASSELPLFTPSGLPLIVAKEASRATLTSLTTPLLTRFTPPADCMTTWLELATAPGPTTYQPGDIVTAVLDTGSTKSCVLNEMVSNKGKDFSSYPVVYSPGVCRAGYTPASTITIGPFPIGHATTSLCCLEGLTILTKGIGLGNCGGTITSSDISILQGTSGNVTTSTVVDSFFAINIPYTVAWASSELPLFTPSGLPLIIARESKLESTTSSVSGNPLAGDGARVSSSLSPGAQAGIGVTAALVGVAIGACVMWFLFIRKRSRRREDFVTLEAKVKDVDDSPRMPELGVEGGRSEVAAKEKAVEMYADVGHEFSQDWGQEVDAGMRHELDGNYRGEELTDIATPIDGDSPTWTQVIEKLRPIHHRD